MQPLQLHRQLHPQNHQMPHTQPFLLLTLQHPLLTFITSHLVLIVKFHLRLIIISHSHQALKVIPLQHLLLQLLTLLVLVDGHTMSIIVLFLQALHQLLILTQLIHLQLVHQNWLLTYHPCQKYPIVLVEAMTQEVQWPRRLHHFHHLLHVSIPEFLCVLYECPLPTCIIWFYACMKVSFWLGRLFTWMLPLFAASAVALFYNKVWLMGFCGVLIFFILCWSY